jgi:hypothetical protein
MKCLKCDGYGVFENADFKDFTCDRCASTGAIDFYTEQELKDQCTPEFIKWMCELAEGFEYKEETEHDVDYFIFKQKKYFTSVPELFPLLIHRAVEGWNKITRNKYIIITDTFLYTTSNLHQGDERYNYNNYQPQSLTQCECAMLHCLLDIFKRIKNGR